MITIIKFFFFFDEFPDGSKGILKTARLTFHADPKVLTTRRFFMITLGENSEHVDFRWQASPLSVSHLSALDKTEQRQPCLSTTSKVEKNVLCISHHSNFSGDIRLCG